MTFPCVLIIIKGNAETMSRTVLDTVKVQAAGAATAITSIQYQNHVILCHAFIHIKFEGC